MDLEGIIKGLKVPDFEEVTDLARWYVKHQEKLKPGENKKIPSVVKFAAAFSRVKGISKQKKDYFRRQTNHVSYILNAQVKDENGNRLNLMRSEIERILDNRDIESCFAEGRFSYDMLRKVLRENVNRDKFIRRDTNERVSDKYLDRCIFFASELWGKGYVLKYMLEKYDYSCLKAAKKLKLSPIQVYKKLSEAGIKLNELKQDRYKAIQHEKTYNILLRKEETIPNIYFTPRYLIERLGITRQGFSEYLRKRVRLDNDSIVRDSLRISPGVYRDILDNYSHNEFRNFGVHKIREYHYKIYNSNERQSNPTPHSGVELRLNLMVTTSKFRHIMEHVLGITPHTRNRYSFSDRAFSNLISVYGPK
jgi:hypothetical protein